MLSDMVSRGSFQRHIMTTGGTTATAVRTVQLQNESTLRANPMMNAADIQRMAMTGLIDINCMFQV